MKNPVHLIQNLVQALLGGRQRLVHFEVIRECQTKPQMIKLAGSVELRPRSSSGAGSFRFDRVADATTLCGGNATGGTHSNLKEEPLPWSLGPEHQNLCNVVVCSIIQHTTTYNKMKTRHSPRGGPSKTRTT